MRIHQKNNDADGFIRSRSISEPEIFFDKSAIDTNRFKAQHFPFEYIAVDDLHYYRRRKPYLFQSNISLCNKESSSSYKTEYKQNFYEKACCGKLSPCKRPPNLSVDAYPFLTGSKYKSEPSLNNLNTYSTEYETNFHSRAFSPRVGLLRRPTNIKLNPGVMDIFSEQKSQYKPYSEEIVSRARPPMIKKPNNLFLTGDIELFPEYKTSYVPYSLDSIYKFNKPPCYHPKREKKVRNPPRHPHEYVPKAVEEPPQIMSERNKPLDAKILNNNYGVPCTNRYHQKLDTENNYLPEYRSKYQPNIGQKSSLIPQVSHLNGYDGDDHFRGASEYTNRYKTYDHFTKSAPIKKEDNLHMMGTNDMRPEYKERYKEVDLNTFERRYPYRQQDNLQSEGDFGRELPEYHEKYKHHHISSFPERAKPRSDFLCLNGDMDYSAEYRKNYVEFPRQRPIVKKPPTNVRMPSSHERDPRDTKKDSIDLPINLPYHETGSTRPMRMGSQEEDEIPIECRPEYRRAMRNYMMKERSPTRASGQEIPRQQPLNESAGKATDPNDVGKILSENKVNVVQEKIFDENNEIIVEPLRRPENFKIPTRSPVRHPSGKGPTYPLQKDHRFNEPVDSQKRNSGRRGNMKVVIDDYDTQHARETFSYENEQQQEMNAPFQASMKKSPKFGRRAPNLTEDYNLRTKTNVVEANPRYVRERRSDIQPNRHEQRGYYQQSNQHPLPLTQPDTLASNYRPNYELNKQQNYRESLRSDSTPFVVIDQQTKRNSVKPNQWMKKQWYDTQ